ncbi:hypothetical protein ACUIJO_11340 [Klebsiella aerogenes]|uniref:hypothetical protein n=1 Tax=Klebsiella TaxID=570 RepID=UPI0015E56EAF|nr:hypothetical protein [Klebsiella grimontii]QLP07458.1 hypothetical protein HV042_10520 [Klebsiella grimontii]DAL30421.1 MAG TPA_asm: autophagy protein [Caudoviricetes sp.]
MEIVKSENGYVVRVNGQWKEGCYETEEVAELAVTNLSDMDLSQLWMLVLMDNRKAITMADYESYISTMQK